MNKDLQAVRDSIQHWKRMMEWVEDNIVSDSEFGKKEISAAIICYNIHENWTANYCALCELYIDDCAACPLYKIGKMCNFKKSPWFRVSHSRAWQSWLNNAKRYMIPALKKAEKFCEKNINRPVN